MQFGSAVGTACASFAITSIDDIFVLVTFFAEASTRQTLTPLKITFGQALGFTVIVAVSMIGFGASLILPSEPIDFLGLLPILLGFWKAMDLLFPGGKEEEAEKSAVPGMKSVLKVSIVTVMKGGNNIATYVPLFSQARGAEIAVYVIVFYILLGLWCLAAFLIMKQRHILAVCEKYAAFVVPLLYIGLGTYIIVKSDCYPWSIRAHRRCKLRAPGPGHHGRHNHRSPLDVYECHVVARGAEEEEGGGSACS
jgi:cadmium resistance protein CadD (predicted permease)